MLFHLPDPQPPSMEDAGSQRRIRAAISEHPPDVLRRSGAPRGDERDGYGFCPRVRQVPAVAVLSAIPVDARQQNLTGTQTDRPLPPSPPLQPGRGSPRVRVAFPPTRRPSALL